MSIPLVIVVAGMYLAVAFSQWRCGHNGLAVMFASYALANVGVIMEMMR
jgi:hypothetical protein